MQRGPEVSLETLFRSAVCELRHRDVQFAVAGGFAADLYRMQPRVTMDVDLVVLTDAHPLETAVSVIEALGLHAGIARKADLDGGPLFAIRRHNTEPCMIVGRTEGTSGGEGVDILLPAIPWVRDAVLRAQSNLVDFGFGPVPVLSVEDVVLSKLYALRASPLRAKDLDDLQSIFEAGHELDTAYLAGRIQQFGIAIPAAAKPLLPKVLLKLARQAHPHVPSSRSKQKAKAKREPKRD